MNKKNKRKSGKVADAYVGDTNRYYAIKKKQKADSYIAQAMAFPSEVNTKLAFSSLSDYAFFLTADEGSEEKDKLNNKREELKEISSVLHGSPKDPKTKKLYKKYKVFRRTQQKGRFTYTNLVNLPNLINKMTEIFSTLVDVSQDLGFGSVEPIQRKYGMDKLLEETGLSPEDIND